MNLYSLGGSNPINTRDPSGLDFWDDAIDDQIAEITGQKLYALGAINEGARIASIGLGLALNIASSILPGSGLYDAFKSVQVIASGRGGFWDAMNIALAALPVAKGVATLMGFKSLAKGWGVARRGCNCFIAGTMVDTPQGPVAIETLKAGDEILTRHQDRPGDPATPGRVTRVFGNLAPVILWLTLSTGNMVGTTPGHEVWTFESGWTFAAELQTGDTFMDAEGEGVSILNIQLDPTPTPVYNFEVDGTWTYFAEGAWVHNNSCGGEYLHHIATNKYWKADPQWSAKFASLFARGGMTLEDAANTIHLATHAGPHSQQYHRLVYRKLREAIEGKTSREAIEDAIRVVLEDLADIIRRDPGIINR